MCDQGVIINPGMRLNSGCIRLVENTVFKRENGEGQNKGCTDDQIEFSTSSDSYHSCEICLISMLSFLSSISRTVIGLRCVGTIARSSLQTKSLKMLVSLWAWDLAKNISCRVLIALPLGELLGPQSLLFALFLCPSPLSLSLSLFLVLSVLLSKVSSFLLEEGKSFVFFSVLKD